MARSTRSWLFWFALTMSVLVGLASWIAYRLPSFRDPPLNFYAMRPGEYFDPFGLTRRQGGSVKVGFAESQPAPPIAAYGNHIIAFFGADAFGQPERAEYFFNYHYANVALPEVLEMLTHIEAHGHLPSKLMIVQITAPNADNGRFIINHGNELPPDIVLHSAPGASVAERAKAFFDTSWRVAEINLHEVLNYNTLILGALQNDGTIRMTGPAYCATNPPRPSPPDWFKPLPWPVRKILFPYLVRDHCNDKAWDWTLRRDGSAMPETRPLVLDEDKLGPNDRGLHAGDEAEIAKYMRAIDAVGRRHGVKVAFLITPVYETDRHDSVVNRVMDDALSMTKDLTVIDDRPLRTDPTFFVNYLHPSPKYYRDLADRLRAQGLLDGIEPRPPPSTAQQGNHVGKR